VRAHAQEKGQRERERERISSSLPAELYPTTPRSRI